MNLAIDYQSKSISLANNILDDIHRRLNAHNFIVHCPTEEDMHFITDIAVYFGITVNHNSIFFGWREYNTNVCISYVDDDEHLYYCDIKHYREYYPGIEIIEYNSECLDRAIINEIKNIIKKGC